MGHPKQRHGTHTWDLLLHYYQCPQCGYVMENRDKFEVRLHHLEKEVCCPRCQHLFTVKKEKQVSFGPLLGHDPEVDN